MSIGSFASIASIGSAGSVLSIGSAGSILSIGSAGSLLSVASAGSILSRHSTGGILRDGDRPMLTRSLATHVATVVVAGLAVGAVTASVARLQRRCFGPTLTAWTLPG